MKKSLLNAFILLVIPFISIRISFEEKVIERNCVLDQLSISSWKNAFELKNKSEEVIYSLPGTGRHHINIDMQG